ncbi:spore germination protein [Paenibacillus sp. WQ 127069]|uniref:Spore germination protein n=1 Tax=Paenibacillus baimaensis TaxID=2982185 RepID=A0ABT2UFA1_9BACL|nr:spore germination protein [Paenibacillus sp. WQ 127069]MCU6793319.1 spore germination protein [Paenibacillus sp. WQ 127069]
MEKQETISPIQTVLLFLAGMTGSSIVLIPGPLTGAARNGAWLSLLFAFLVGMILLACILYLHHCYPGLSLIEYSRQAIGSGLSLLFAVPFILTLFWQESAIVMEIGDFFKSTMMKNTPTSFINAMFFITIGLTARAGIEVMARMFVVLLFIMFGFIFVVWVLVAPYYHFEYVLPIMPDGIKPILHGAYISLGFPYVEIVIYSMLLPSTRPQASQKLGKYMFGALAINGVTLIISILVSIMVFGPVAGDLKYSLYQLARLIFIEEIIERIESVIGISLIAGSFMKASIVLFILAKAMSQVFRITNYRLLILPIALIALLLSVTMYSNGAAFNEDGYTVWPLTDSLVYALPTLLIVIVTLLKKTKTGRHPT